jgi:hypothetical protein
MLTGYQQQLFRNLMEASWEADNTINSPLMRDLARNEYWRVKQELMDEMGVDAYNDYVEKNKQMFADAYNNYVEKSK